MNDKPISIILNELKQELAEVINSKQLPVCLLTPILKDLYFECAEMEKMQLEKDKQDYENRCKIQEEKE